MDKQKGSIWLVEGRIVRSRGEGAQMSPGATRKHSDHIATDGKQEFDTTSAAEYGEVSGKLSKIGPQKNLD